MASNPQSSFQLRVNIDISEMHRRLRSEYGTAIQSESEIAEALVNIDKDLDKFDAELSHLQSRIVFLQNHRQRLEEYRGCWHSLRSPIRRLPNETVLGIFDFACDMNELTSKTLQTMPALAISGVCSHWRALAKSYPDLWSRIRLEIWATPRHLPGMPILDLYLDSSRQSPLTIELPIPALKTLEPGHLAVCATLGSCSNRWKSIFAWNKVYNELVAHTKGAQFPLLEELRLPNVFFHNETNLKRFQYASNLKSLSVSRVENWVDQQQRKFPWRQLTVLDAAQCDDGMKHLFEMQNLQELRFRQFPDDKGIRLCSPPISAPFVQKLSLSLRRKPEPEPERLANVIFASITCPSLISLFIEGVTGYKHAWPRDVVNGFISRSSFHLTTLSIKFIPLSDSDLIDLLRHLPSLCHLTVDDSGVPADSPSPITPLLVQSLHAFPRRSSITLFSVLVKRLQSLSLTFKGSEEGTFNDKEFVDMVSSRWFPDRYADRYGLDTLNSMNSEGITGCLRSVVMRFTNRDVNEDIYKPLKYFEEEGMMVVVVGQSS